MSYQRSYEPVPTTYHGSQGEVRYPTLPLERPALYETRSDPEPLRAARSPSFEITGSRKRSLSSSSNRHFGTSHRDISNRSHRKTGPRSGRVSKRWDPRSCSTKRRVNIPSDTVIDLTMDEDEDISENIEDLPSPTPPSHTPKLSSQQAHVDLRGLLFQPIKPTKDEQDLGVIYILREIEAPHHIKIGSTRFDRVSQRTKEIKRCGRKFEIIDTSEPIQYYTRTEKLIQKDMAHHQQLFRCGNHHRNHTEWFDVNIETARRHVQRWVTFMNQQQPYNSSGYLTELWRHLLAKRSCGLPKDSMDDDTRHQSRCALWDALLEPPSMIDYLESTAKSVRKNPLAIFAWEFSWQISCVLTSLVISCTLNNRFTFYAFIGMILCAVKSALFRKARCSRR